MQMRTGQPPVKRVMVVYGTRPEAIKLAPVIRAIRASQLLTPIVTLTGQHRAVVDQVNTMFGVRPDHDLNLIRPRQSLDGLTSRVLRGLTLILRQERPDAVVVQGDTTSAFAGALAAFYERLPVVHVEAGLRTGDIYAPFPEEANRRLTSQITTLHLAPTPVSADNLLRSGIPPQKVLVTGNTVIDALLWTVGQRAPYGNQALEAVDSSKAPVLLVTTHRRESWGPRMRGVAHAVARLARSHPDLIVVLPVHPNPVVRDTLLPVLRGQDNVLTLEPMSYGAFARLLRRSTIVLTDSGGVQEEAPSLGKPVLVMRDTTERPEAVTAGTARLVGTDPDRVYAEVDHLLTSAQAYQAMANAVNPYGDGRAAERTAGAIEHMFGLGARPAPFRPPGGACGGQAALAADGTSRSPASAARRRARALLRRGSLTHQPLRLALRQDVRVSPLPWAASWRLLAATQRSCPSWRERGCLVSAEGARLSGSRAGVRDPGHEQLRVASSARGSQRLPGPGPDRHSGASQRPAASAGSQSIVTATGEVSSARSAETGHRRQWLAWPHGKNSSPAPPR
jgi:UDP-N-acetylglucosamine 2-epimerase (non-hydrolysing)